MQQAAQPGRQSMVGMGEAREETVVCKRGAAWGSAVQALRREEHLIDHGLDGGA